MRQRAKLAMSLVHDPEILILDEPTVGLDPAGRHQLLELIAGLRDQGRRILLSTHILNDAEQVCDQILLIEDGRAIWSGPVAELLGGGLGSVEVRGARVEALEAALRAAGVPVREASPGRLLLDPRGDEDLARFWELAAGANVEVRRMATQSRSLEEAIMATLEASHHAG